MTLPCVQSLPSAAPLLAKPSVSSILLPATPCALPSGFSLLLLRQTPKQIMKQIEVSLLIDSHSSAILIANYTLLRFHLPSQKYIT